MESPLLLCITLRHVRWFTVSSATRSRSVTSAGGGFPVTPRWMLQCVTHRSLRELLLLSGRGWWVGALSLRIAARVSKEPMLLRLQREINLCWKRKKKRRKKTRRYFWSLNTKQNRKEKINLIWHTLLWAMFLDPLSFLPLIATW